MNWWHSSVYFCYPSGWPWLVCPADAYSHPDHCVGSQPDDGFQSTLQLEPQTVSTHYSNTYLGLGAWGGVWKENRHTSSLNFCVFSIWVCFISFIPVCDCVAEVTLTLHAVSWLLKRVTVRSTITNEHSQKNQLIKRNLSNHVFFSL